MTETILPHELPDALDRGPDGMKFLSLDCFDTLLWRDCHAPADLFADLTAVLPGQRIVAETKARKSERTLRAKSEVPLGQIYDHALPNASPQQCEEAIETELASEAQTCFAFAPTVQLMREAKARGIKVIIVSDTYLDSRQLKTLIAKAAGEEVAGLIDRIFASSSAGISKGQGLLAKVLKAMKCRAQDVLHIGDNKAADYDSARALGIPALHLRQFSEAAHQRLRFERACQQITGETSEGVQGLQPHRALLAQREPTLADPAEALGFGVLGPIFQGYEQWLRQEANTIQAERGGRVHRLFMLRDGHLPYLVHQAADAQPDCARVEISRFVATAASLTTRDTYHRHLGLEYGLNPSTLARQMLLTEDEITQVVGDPQSDAELIRASTRLLAELRKGQRQKLTQRRARGYADRLVAHIRKTVAPDPGDTLMLVDLGYNGSVQNRIDFLLQEELGVHVAGRYLLLREMEATGLDKKGLIDARHYDPQFLEALCANVAVIEQLATCQLGSVVDFSDEGEPIRTNNTVKARQSDVRDAVQGGVVAFAKAAQDPPIIRCRDAHGERGWRECAASALSRFVFFPSPGELEVLSNFEHDVNIGSDRMVSLFDAGRAHEGMRRRGLFYMKGSSRMFLPAELAGEDINTRIALMVQKRFGLGLTYADQTSKTIDLPVFHVSQADSASSSTQAIPTHDGYYAARIPIGENAAGIALQFGAQFDWIELVSVTRSPVRGLKGGTMNDVAPVPVSVQFDGIREHAPGILQCTEPSGLVLARPNALIRSDEPQMLEVVFRPLRRSGVAKTSFDLKPNPSLANQEAAA